MTELAELAKSLRELHRPGDPLLLPNAWDAASARTVVAAGFPVVATSSAAVNATLGQEDGEKGPVDEVFAAARRIAAAVDVPVTADLERGYRLGPAEFVDRMLAAGLVGCNLEDSDPATGELVDPAEQADLLAGVRAAADAAGVSVVINARVDVHLRTDWSEDRKREAATARALAYLAAGADCVYPIFATDLDTLTSLATVTGGRTSALQRPGAPSLAELTAAGVSRVSWGAGLHKLMSQLFEQTLAKIKAGETGY